MVVSWMELQNKKSWMTLIQALVSLRAPVGSMTRKNSGFYQYLEVAESSQGFPPSMFTERGHGVENPSFPNLPKALRS